MKKTISLLTTLFLPLLALAQGPRYHGVFMGDGNLLTNMFNGGTNTVYVSATFGNDANAVIADPFRPFATFSNAWATAFNVTSNPVFILSPETHFVTTSSNSGTIFAINAFMYPTIIGWGATLLFTNTSDQGAQFLPKCFDELGTNFTLTIIGAQVGSGPIVTNNASRMIWYGNANNGGTNYLQTCVMYPWVADCIHGSAGAHVNWLWYEVDNCKFYSAFDILSSAGSAGSLFGGNFNNCLFYSSTNSYSVYSNLGVTGYATTPRGIILTRGAFQFYNCRFYGDTAGVVNSGSFTKFYHCNFQSNTNHVSNWIADFQNISGTVEMWWPETIWTNCSIAGTVKWMTPFLTNGPGITGLGTGGALGFDGANWYIHGTAP